MRTSATAAICVCLAASAAAADRPLREAPARTDVAGSMVGRVIANRAFLDAAGRPLSLASVPAPRATVLAVTSTACPLSKRWYGTLVKTAEAYAGRGVRFLVVNPMTTEDSAAVTADAKRLGDAGTYVLDPDKALADAIGARTTTDVVVLDASRKVVYHGAVDDQYGFGYANAAPKTQYVADALDDLLADRPVARPATSSPGCLLRRRQPTKTSDVEKPPTYFGHVDRILDANCVGCHREGGVAPFALDSLAAASDYAEMIADVVDRGVMPPWFAEPADDTPTGPWANDRTLPPDDLATLKAWIAADAPAGDPGAASVKIARADGWQIGTPDAVFTFDEPVPVKADGVMPYQNVTVETRLAEDRWVRAIEVKPGERAVVHHALVWVISPGSSDREFRERDGFWAAYVPGNSSVVYPEGYGKLLPAGSRLRFQMHYTPVGTATEDRTSLGVVFADEPPTHVVRSASLVNPGIDIPPGEPFHPEVATLRVPGDIELLAFMPHMHLRGTAARYELKRGGDWTTLLEIPRYDFNWQLSYRLARPLSLTAGDLLKFTAWYDNSAANPANPDPNRSVTWGRQTYDEMMLGYVEYVLADGDSPDSLRPKPTDRLAGLLFDRLDADHDGALDAEEWAAAGDRFPRARRLIARAEGLFDVLDGNRDGRLDVTEFAGIIEAARAAGRRGG